MSAYSLQKRLRLGIIAALLAVAIPIDSHAQASKSKAYEDREIRVAIPPDWRILSRVETKRLGQTSVGNSVANGLILEKNGYILALAYHTGHASGIVGGRFIEVFAIPWPGVGDQWTCSGHLREDPWPAGRHLIFVNLVVDTGDPRAREECGVQKDLGYWIEKDGQKEYVGDRRWFGGYFRSEYGGYFFGSDYDGCGLKAYTLTSQTKTPERLPIPDNPNQNNNPALEKIIEETIDIVDSIHYKKCAPW